MNTPLPTLAADTAAPAFPSSTVASLPAAWRAALDALRRGDAVLVLDDEDRENEADLIAAASTMQEATMARMIRDGSGIVCLCLDPDTVDRLGLPPMSLHNESRFGTAFTVSIEAREGIGTGVSARDRLTTIAAALGRAPGGVASPGHVFPLRAARGGLAERRGHTEASVELAQAAGLAPAGVLCELMNPDGSMARGEQVQRYAEAHGLVVLTLDDILQMRALLREA
ncbi:3,4-dihydroxy-2-butanone-4-phosphate synthase [Eleftheria terrae]|uniref:3,4-dihydroxy-2-butanone-4-phosphate synthase n=1 Tax=Eleftheria terrae TaxID=1597781 RepID=UPI00263AA00B|nr:3,4-dihydroxy-2-butanone-4-phosphate synthase [Eleftheria terrae]WKB51151.1 3,4-dihydroxy-2-butanone-4-phosphate synthase [Eleftheria terrae]